MVVVVHRHDVFAARRGVEECLEIQGFSANLHLEIGRLGGHTIAVVAPRAIPDCPGERLRRRPRQLSSKPKSAHRRRRRRGEDATVIGVPIDSQRTLVIFHCSQCVFLSLVSLKCVAGGRPHTLDAVLVALLGRLDMPRIAPLVLVRSALELDQG